MVPSTKNPLPHDVHVLASEQVRQSGIEEQAPQVVPLRKKPLEQAEQVVPSCEQVTQSERVVLQDAHEAPKKPAPHEVQVDASVQVMQLGIEVVQELHVLALRKNPEEQALHVAPSKEQSEQSATEVLQAPHAAPKKPVLQAEQVVPSCEQAVHSAIEVLQAAHEAPKKPALQAEQVVPSCEQAVHSAIAELQVKHELP